MTTAHLQYTKLGPMSPVNGIVQNGCVCGFPHTVLPLWREVA